LKTPAVPGVTPGDHGGATLAFGSVAAVGFAVTPVAGFESVADGAGAVTSGCLEHAAQMARSVAKAERLLISGLPF
jgi:hypothetical protein